MSDNEAEEDKTSLNDEDIDGWVSDGDLSGLDDEDVDLALADLDTPKKAAAKVKESSSTESDVKFLDSKSATFDVVATSVEPTKDVEAVAAEVSTAESVAESVPESLDGLQGDLLRGLRGVCSTACWAFVGEGWPPRCCVLATKDLSCRLGTPTEFLKGDREGDGEMGFADISFEHCFYINGGLDFVE
eukprot:gene26686-32780_t